MSTAIVIPCFNEAQRLDREAFLGFAWAQPQVRFVFVNDGSGDDTESCLREMSAAAPARMEIVNLPENQGKAGAVRAGLLRALESRVSYVGFWDADLATPLEEIPRFVATLDRLPHVQMVAGTRLPLLGHEISRSPTRGMLGCAFAAAASRVVGMRFRDTQCGAKLFRASKALRAALQDRFVSRWIFDVELIARLQGQLSEHFWVYEQPLERWRDVQGSRLRARDFARAPWELWCIYRKHRVVLRQRGLATLGSRPTHRDRRAA